MAERAGKSFSRLKARARYGPWAVVAGASEGLGEQFALQVAEQGLNVVLVARREELLAEVAARVARLHGVETRAVPADLASGGVVATIRKHTEGLEVGLLVYNAALSVVGSFFDQSVELHLEELEVNCRKPLELVHHFGRPMLERGRGGILLMSSLAGGQGSPCIAHYGATKAWNRVLAEGLWDELREHGVDVAACCAGATRTPRYLSERGSEDESALVPVMEPRDVAAEALAALGSVPSMVPGRANRAAAFVLQRLLPRSTAVRLMGNASRRVGVE
jgi:short-subunit dehydrogenase